MSSISIPEPCHENWADFTPTQKGAFCGSCSIDVYDFSNKTPDEIKVILKENQGKHLCGRFRKSQLDELNNEFTAWENQSPRTFQSRFLYACLIVFGMSLFTSCNVSEKDFLSGIGIEWTNDGNEAQLNLIGTASENDTDTNKVRKNELRKGKVKYEPEQILMGKPAMYQNETENNTPPDSLEKSSTVEENMTLKGNVVCNVDLLNNLDTEETVMGDTLYNDQMVDGEIRWIPEFEEFVEDTALTEKIQPVQETEEIHVKGEIAYTLPISETQDTQEIIEETSFTEPVTLNIPQFEAAFEAQLYPNPVLDQTTVVINVRNEQLFNIYLYAINGKMVKDIYQGMLASGRQEFMIDLIDYEAGSYLIVINSEKQKESLKLEKLR